VKIFPLADQAVRIGGEDLYRDGEQNYTKKFPHSN
jgi:hypothetical protein